MRDEFNETAEKIHNIFQAMGWEWANKVVNKKFKSYKPTLKDIKKCMKQLKKSINSKASVCVKTGRIVCMNTYGCTEYFIDL